MTYYAHINSHGELRDIDKTRIVYDEYGSDKVENIEVSEEIYFNRERYIYEDGEIVLNPNYEEEQLAKAKADKYAENDLKASETRYNQEFTIKLHNRNCIFDTSEQTQRDLLTAFAVCSSGGTYDGWVTNNGVTLNLTLEDVTLISATFKEKSDVYGTWNEYKTAIDEAETIEEVNNIIINYDGE